MKQALRIQSSGVEEEVSHVYLEGTLLSVRASDPEVFQAVCEQARPIAMGKNFSLANFWCVPNDSMRLTTGGVVPAFHMRKLVSFADKDKFAVAVCGGEHPNVVLLKGFEFVTFKARV